MLAIDRFRNSSQNIQMPCWLRLWPSMAPRIYNAYIQTYNTLEITLEFYIYFVIRNTRSPQNSQLSVGHFLVLYSLRFTEQGDDSDLVCICKIVLRPKEKCYVCGFPTDPVLNPLP